MTKPDEVRDRLRTVLWPGYTKDIVTAGFVHDVAIDAGVVTVQFAPETAREDKVAEMVDGMRVALEGLEGVHKVVVRRVERPSDLSLSHQGSLTPLQGQIEAVGRQPDPDPILKAVSTVPPAEGPHWTGSRPDARGRPIETAWTGSPAVHQWEVDPRDEALAGGDAQIMLGDWEYRMWWKIHPADLWYVSIQAIQDDNAAHGGRARPHPVGRAVAVNIVYDTRREAIVAIYGTARDFRPFVEAFRQGAGLPDKHHEGAE